MVASHISREILQEMCTQRDEDEVGEVDDLRTIVSPLGMTAASALGKPLVLLARRIRPRCHRNATRHSSPCAYRPDRPRL